jgi:hypothetical protein
MQGVNHYTWGLYMYLGSDQGADIRRTRGNPPPPLGTQLCAWGPGQGYLYQEKVAREAAIIGHDISDHQSPSTHSRYY